MSSATYLRRYPFITTLKGSASRENRVTVGECRHPASSLPLFLLRGGRRSTRDYYAKCLSVSGWVFRASAIYLRVLYSWDCVSRSVVARRQAYSSLRRVTRLKRAFWYPILVLVSLTYSYVSRVGINRLLGAPTVTLLPNVVQLILLLKCLFKLLLALLGAPSGVIGSTTTYLCRCKVTFYKQDRYYLF